MIATMHEDGSDDLTEVESILRDVLEVDIHLCINSSFIISFWFLITYMVIWLIISDSRCPSKGEKAHSQGLRCCDPQGC